MAVLLSLHQSSELKPRPNYPHLNGRPHPPSTAPRLAAKLLGLSMILLTVLVPVADSSLSDIAIITTSIPTMETKMYKFSWQRATFYANGLYYAFWENTGTCEGQTGCLYYATSPDGLTWNTPVNVGVHVTREDFSLTTNSTHAFYARFNETSFFSNSCSRPLLFRAGALSSPIIWQPERVVKPGNTTAQWINPVVRLDSNNQAWIGYMDNSNSVCGGNGIQVPVVIHSQGTNYAAWSGQTILTTAHSAGWAVDLASLPNRAMYAVYWLHTARNSDLHGRLYNGTWLADEQISPVSDLLDTDAFVFSSGTTIHTVWLDTNTRKLSYNTRIPFPPSSGTWGTTVRIATAHCCSNNSFYPIPWTATYEGLTSNIHVYWYNYTHNRIDLYSGLSTNWIGPSLGWNTNQADILSSLTAFHYSSTTLNNATIGVLFIDGSSIRAPVLKYVTENIDPPPSSGPAGGGGGSHIRNL